MCVNIVSFFFARLFCLEVARHMVLVLELQYLFWGPAVKLEDMR